MNLSHFYKWERFISSIILLLFAKPILTKKLKVGKNKTNTDTLIGKTGLVIKPIKPFSYGQVKVKGTIWTAKSEDNKKIPINTKVTILNIEGVKLIVKEKEKNKEVVK